MRLGGCFWGGIVGLWGMLLWATPTWADRMVLDNGEVLAGTLIRMEQGQVTFESQYLARLTVAYDHVTSLTTEHKVTLCLRNGEVLEQILVDTNEPACLGLQQDQGRAVTLADVVAINPQPQKEETPGPGEAFQKTRGEQTPQVDSPGQPGPGKVSKDAVDSESGQAPPLNVTEKPKTAPEPEKPQKEPEEKDKKTYPWTGSFNTGVSSLHGNTRKYRYSGSLSLNRRLEKVKMAFTSDYARAEETDVDTGEKSVDENYWKAYSKLSYYFTDKNYSYLDGRYETDSVANLDRRVAIGMGAGYQVLEKDQIKLSMDMGGASLREKYDPEEDSDTSELSLQMGYDFDLKINDHLKVTHDLTYYPNGRKFSDYYLTSTAELKRKITDKVSAYMKGIFNYDAVPASDSLSTDIKYMVGLGINF